MKILLIDPTLVYPGERAKLAAFAAIPWITLEALSGEQHRDEARLVRMPKMEQCHGIPFYQGQIIGKFPNRTLLFGGLQGCLLRRPDVILAYSDWNHWLTLEIALAKNRYSPHSKLIIQAWENQAPTWFRHPQPSVLFYALDSIIERIIYRHSDGAVARNAEAQAVLERRGFRKPVHLIPWGVDMELFKPRRSSDARFTVGYVGRLVPEKGVADLLTALRGLNDIKALIIGSGPDEPNLRKLVARHNVLAEFVATVPQETLPEWYGQMDVLVLPSRTTRKWAEQFGRVLVEAMAMGIPAIGSDSGAIPWVIGDRELIYPEGNVQQLQDRILMLKSSDHLRRIKANESRRRARETFTWEKHANSTVEFCREVYSCSR